MTTRSPSSGPPPLALAGVAAGSAAPSAAHASDASGVVRVVSLQDGMCRDPAQDRLDLARRAGQTGQAARGPISAGSRSARAPYSAARLGRRAR